MYRLLIVDDEVYALQSIASCVDWEGLNICEVRTAYNIRAARKLFSQEDFDIVITDIEMPQGDGLELIAWIAANHPRTACICLTCHTEFNYARHAVRLGVVDYLLKPASAEDIAKVVTKAINRITQMTELRSHSELWSKNKETFVENFWNALIRGDIASEPEAIQAELSRMDIRFDPDAVFTPLIIEILYEYPLPPGVDPDRIKDDLLRRARCVFLHGDALEQVTAIKRDLLFAALRAAEDMDSHGERIRRACEELVKQARQYAGCEIFCIWGRSVAISRIRGAFAELYSRREEGALSAGGRGDDDKTKRSKSVLPYFQHWCELLKQGNREQLRKAIDDFFSDWPRGKNLGIRDLRAIQRNFVQVLSSALFSKEVMAQQVFLDADEYSRESATQSLSELRQWMERAVERAIDAIVQSAREQTLSEKIKIYIRQNIGNERALNRNEIARYFFVSADYLGRVFKKETGSRLSDFILSERINLAKDDLRNTNLPISDIASFVGYTNFSYFSRVFKDATGVTPLEYRKQGPLSR